MKPFRPAITDGIVDPDSQQWYGAIELHRLGPVVDTREQNITMGFRIVTPPLKVQKNPEFRGVTISVKNTDFQNLGVLLLMSNLVQMKTGGYY